MQKVLSLKMSGLVILALSVSACVTDQQYSSIQQELAAEQSAKAEAVARADDVQSKATALELQLAQAKVGMSQAKDGKAGDKVTDLPPNAKPGECFARVLVPEQHRTEALNVLVSPEGNRVVTTQPKYARMTEKVLISEASKRYEITPATYKKVKERILVAPEQRVLEPVEAKYKTVSERVEVRPAYQVWKSGRGPIEKLDEATGEIMCLVTIPAVYKNLQKQVVMSPATTKTIVIPAKYETVTKTVVDKPAMTREVIIPAKYGTLQVSKLVQPATQKKIKVPAVYQSVQKRVQVSDATLEWRPILCETNTTPGVVMRLQTALKDKGYNPGNIDGVYGADTERAVVRFQKANSLPSGKLTLETLQRLNIGMSDS